METLVISHTYTFIVNNDSKNYRIQFLGVVRKIVYNTIELQAQVVNHFNLTRL